MSQFFVFFDARFNLQIYKNEKEKLAIQKMSKQQQRNFKIHITFAFSCFYLKLAVDNLYHRSFKKVRRAKDSLIFLRQTY